MTQYTCQFCSRPRKFGQLCEVHRLIRVTRKKSKTKSGKRKYENPLVNDIRWQKISKRYLHSNPICVRCKLKNRIKSSVEVDHVKPTKKYPELIYDEGNLQALCMQCHRIKTSRYEMLGLYPDYVRRVVHSDA